MPYRVELEILEAQSVTVKILDDNDSTVFWINTKICNDNKAIVNAWNKMPGEPYERPIKDVEVYFY